MKLRSVYHTPKGERGIGKWIVGWTWVLAVFYSVPGLFRKPPEGKTRWQAYKQALKYNFSHEELWIPDSLGSFRDFIDGYTGKCFSSTTRGDSNGVRFAPASEVLGKHPGRWKYIEFEVDDKLFDNAMVSMGKKVGNKYDFVAVTTGFVTPVLIDDKDKNYCSGVCCWAKWLMNVLRKWWKVISPRRSALIMAKLYHEPKPI